MIPVQFNAANLSDNGIMLAENDSLRVAFLTRAQNPTVFDQWARYIRENWTEQPGDLFGYTRPETNTVERKPHERRKADLE